ncbi:tyrosine-type recombinase/integrase [Emticicia sp. C21]|uniref:tyrosine-type recombinase/integrase n=1 Tax=Emticicia sp. C21 TaxID=2302915 RepID=UPI000E34EFEE|nr:site-specific integrase [Emticicia sp. C21]
MVNNQPLYLFTRFIFYSFIRPKELLNLQVKDIDLTTRTIKVKSDVSKNKRTETVPILKPLLSLIIENKVLETQAITTYLDKVLNLLKPCKVGIH